MNKDQQPYIDFDFVAQSLRRDRSLGELKFGSWLITKKKIYGKKHIITRLQKTATKYPQVYYYERTLIKRSK